jgi:hypothetical protein
MCNFFWESWLHGLWDYNVWSWQNSFFPCVWQGQQSLTAFGAKFLNYAILGFCTIVMHIMLSTCVPNLRGRRWVEHTQMHLALEKGTKNFHYTSNSWRIFCEFTLSLDKIPWIWRSWFNLILGKKKIVKKMKSPCSMRNGRFHPSKCRGKVQKTGEETLEGLSSNLLIHIAHLFGHMWSTLAGWL